MLNLPANFNEDPRNCVGFWFIYQFCFYCVVFISSINHKIEDARITYEAVVSSLKHSIGSRHKMLIKTTDENQNSVHNIVDCCVAVIT